MILCIGPRTLGSHRLQLRGFPVLDRLPRCGLVSRCYSGQECGRQGQLELPSIIASIYHPCIDHAHLHSHPPIPTHLHSHSPTLTLIYNHTHLHPHAPTSHSPTYTHTHLHSHPPTPTHLHSHSPTLTPTNTHPPTLTLTYTHTHLHSHPPTHYTPITAGCSSTDGCKLQPSSGGRACGRPGCQQGERYPPNFVVYFSLCFHLSSLD